VTAERTFNINGNKIEEFYWNGRFIVYVNGKLSEKTYEEAREYYSVNP
jgi:hypothetical protein